MLCSNCRLDSCTCFLDSSNCSLQLHLRKAAAPPLRSCQATFSSQFSHGLAQGITAPFALVYQGCEQRSRTLTHPGCRSLVLEEFQQFMKKHTPQQNAAKAKEMMDFMDVDGDGQVTLEEYIETVDFLTHFMSDEEFEKYVDDVLSGRGDAIMDDTEAYRHPDGEPAAGWKPRAAQADGNFRPPSSFVRGHRAAVLRWHRPCWPSCRASAAAQFVYFLACAVLC